MNIDPQNNKFEQTFSHKYLVRSSQNEPGQSPRKNEPSQSFNNQISHVLKFSAWLLLYRAISKMFNLTKSELAKAWLDVHKELLYGFETTHLAHIQTFQRG